MKIYKTTGEGYNDLQRPLDALRSVFGGRYKIAKDCDGNPVVSKRYGISTTDRPLNDADFSGLSSEDNKRLLRKLQKYFEKRKIKGLPAPKKISFYVGAEDTKDSPQDAIRDGNDLLTRIPYARFGENIEKKQKENDNLILAGKVGVPAGIAGALIGALAGFEPLRDSSLIVGGIASLLALYGWAADSNFRTLYDVRNYMKSNGMGVDFVHATDKSKNHKAFVIRSSCADCMGNRYRFDEPDHSVLEVANSEAYRPYIRNGESLAGIVSARTERGLQRKLDRLARKLEKHGGKFY